MHGAEPVTAVMYKNAHSCYKYTLQVQRTAIFEILFELFEAAWMWLAGIVLPIFRSIVNYGPVFRQ
jgi:hypothetical protein